jgi:GNAT superfamily N-acetyltransferase
MQYPNDKIFIRPATAADVAQLSNLLSVLFAQEADFAPDVERQTRGLHLIIEQPAVGRIYRASEDDKIVGMVNILFTMSTAEGGRAAWLEDMVVHPDRRGQDISERLLNAAIAGAQAAGCSRITLLTDADNHSAMRFYQRAGFVRSQMIPFRLSLRAGD